ncbi:MAG: ATP-binding cassette domain-containing protein [Oscillospiraceae bacterium]
MIQLETELFMEIQLNNVTKRLHKAQVIDGITAHFTSGHVYGLQGYNGCGKTMLMRLIAGLLHPTTGTVLVDGKELGKDMDFPDSMGLIIENPVFPDDYTGLANLRLIAGLKGRATEEDIRQALIRSGLNPDDKRRFRKYSLGMKQRLGIAAAIMETPALILLDEPTNALDVGGLEMLKTVIRQERERGALIITASHDMVFLEAVADQVFQMEFGRFVTQGGTA